MASQLSVLGTSEMYLLHTICKCTQNEGHIFVHECMSTHTPICIYAFLVPGPGMKEKIFMVSGPVVDKGSNYIIFFAPYECSY